MPTTYEIIFWIALLGLAVYETIRILATTERSLYISKYALDRMNGAKY